MTKQTYVPTEADRLTGNNVRATRAHYGETLVETIEASGIGIGQSSLSRIELGQRKLSLPEATKLAAHWNTTVDKLIVTPKRPALLPVWSPATEQDWLGNKPATRTGHLIDGERMQGHVDAPTLFVVPDPLGAAAVEVGSTITIDLKQPLTPEQYREQVWIPYLENRYNTEQKAS